MPVISDLYRKAIYGMRKAGRDANCSVKLLVWDVFVWIYEEFLQNVISAIHSSLLYPHSRRSFCGKTAEQTWNWSFSSLCTVLLPVYDWSVPAKGLLFAAVSYGLSCSVVMKRCPLPISILDFWGHSIHGQILSYWFEHKGSFTDFTTFNRNKLVQKNIRTYFPIHIFQTVYI